MTDTREIERVRFIHRQLDQWAADSDTCVSYGILDGAGARHVYTGEEVRNWPRVKGAMVERLRRTGAAYARVEGSGVCHGGLIATLNNIYSDTQRRGLYMTREMLVESARAPGPDDGAPADAPKPDPYKLHDAEVERRLRGHNRFIPGICLDEMVSASMIAEDHLSDSWKEAQTGIKQLSPRERLIAGLRSEHVKAAESTGLLHPLSNWSGRNPGRRSR